VLFTGHYEHTIDSKHRLAIPSDIRSRWRPEQHGDAWFALPGSGRIIRLYTERDFVQRASDYTQSLTPDPEQAELQVTLFGLARRLEMDASGRIRIPEEMLETVRLGQEVVLVGAGDRLEVRDRAEWRDSKQSRLEEMQRLMARIESRRAGRQAAMDGDKG